MVAQFAYKCSRRSVISIYHIDRMFFLHVSKQRVAGAALKVAYLAYGTVVGVDFPLVNSKDMNVLT